VLGLGRDANHDLSCVINESLEAAVLEIVIAHVGRQSERNDHQSSRNRALRDGFNKQWGEQA
jgi:hypothetical protein